MFDYRDNLERGRHYIFYITLIVTLVVNISDIILLGFTDIVIYSNFTNIIICIATLLLFYFKIINIRWSYLVLTLAIFFNIIATNYYGWETGANISAIVFREILFLSLVFTLAAIMVHKYITFVLMAVYSAHLIIFVNLIGEKYLFHNLGLIVFVFLAYAYLISFVVTLLEKIVVTLDDKNLELHNKYAEIDSQNEELKSYHDEILSQREHIEDNLKMLQKSNKELEDAREEQEQLNVTKDKLFSIIAHDIKNPLSIIKTFSDLLIVKYDGIEEKRKLLYIESINNSANKLFSLLENLLFWSRAQMNAIKLKKEDSDLFDIVQTIYLLYEEQFKQKGVKFINGLSEPTVIHVDQNMIMLVIRNIINNALKFTGEGNTVEVDCVVEDKYLRVNIKDNGVGIAQERLPKIFSVSLNKSTQGTKGESGTGIGLMLCKEFVELHGGTISVNSIEGIETVFSFTLPL